LTTAATDTPQNFAVTSYDILKTSALVFMVIDHIGAYFFPDNLELRALGRICVPVWLFLIGYARSRHIDKTLIGCAVVTTLVDMAAVQNFHGLNILWTIMLLRLTLNPLMRWIDDNLLILAGIVLMCFALAPMTRLIFDYGTMGYILAIWGFYTRRFINDKTQDPFFALAYGAIAMILFTLVEQNMFAFDASETALLILGNLGVFYALAIWLPQQETALDWPDVPLWVKKPLSFLGHHTLAFYVFHLVLIDALFIGFCHYGLLLADFCPKLWS
jgi:hypothetical protein